MAKVVLTALARSLKAQFFGVFAFMKASQSHSMTPIIPTHAPMQSTCRIAAQDVNGNILGERVSAEISGVCGWNGRTAKYIHFASGSWP